MSLEGISGSPPGPGMSGAPRVVRRPSSTYVTPSRASPLVVPGKKKPQAQHVDTPYHGGVVDTKVGYFGVKLTKVLPGADGHQTC